MNSSPPPIELNDVRGLLAKIRLALHVFFCGECTWVNSEREARRICQTSVSRVAPILQRATTENKPFELKKAISFSEVVALSFLLPTFGGKKVALRIAVPGTELGTAKVAQATSFMIESFARNRAAEQLKVDLLIDGSSDGFVRHREIWAKCILALKAFLRSNVGFRKVSIRSPSHFFSGTTEKELNSIAASSSEEMRLLVLMGTHERVGARCIFRAMPHPLLEIILEKSGLRTPCKIVVEAVENREGRRHPGQDLDYIADWVE